MVGGCRESEVVEGWMVELVYWSWSPGRTSRDVEMCIQLDNRCLVSMNGKDTEWNGYARGRGRRRRRRRRRRRCSWSISKKIQQKGAEKGELGRTAD
jgi:hypothetical protein